MARERGLWTATKKESMGVCFVGQVGMKEFLSQYVETNPGDIVDRDSGETIATHDGAIFYTLGQRHGLDIGGGLPYYVVGKDMDQNIVYVSRNLNHDSIWRDRIELNNLHWIRGESPNVNHLQCRVRHRAPMVDCEIDESTVTLHEAQRAITAGQSVVFYDAELCLGGGVVVS
jgi:tRNA-specific 2-thiouridylase